MKPIAGPAIVVAVASLALAACGEASEPPGGPSAGTTTFATPQPAPHRGAVAAARRSCTRFVSPRGSNRGPGTRARPWRTLQRLAVRLEPGDVACLRRGTYPGGVTLRRGGTPGRAVTLRGYPGEAARVVGRVWVTRRADNVIFRDLYLDGRNGNRLPSPTVNADDVSFVAVDVTNWHSGICFSLGNSEYGFARRTLIADSRVHDCGRLPATNHDHGVYLARARSARIVRNWIHDNADRGIQLYPDAQGTVVRGNVIARNGQGVIFSGDETVASSDNLVERNVIADSLLRHNVESHYPDGASPGSGNVLRRNCVWGGARDAGTGGIQLPVRGFEPLGNVRANPSFVDPLRGDFRLRSGFCSSLLAAPRKAIPGPVAQPPPLPASLR